MSITRALRFEIVFPGLRKQDREATYRRLWRAQDDSTRAANRLVTALFQVKMGALPQPIEPSKRPKSGKQNPPRPVSIRTLAYRGISGAWQPFGRPFYVPSEEAGVLGGQARSELAEAVKVRLETDFSDVMAGKKALSTFREMPLGVPAQSLQLSEDGTVRLGLWDKNAKNRWVTVRPRKIDEGQMATLRRCARGELKTGSAKLFWRQPENRKGKWYVSLSWTDETDAVAPSQPTALLAGVHLGITNTLSVAYIDLATGKVQKQKDIIQFPEATVRAWNRLRTERKHRSVFNRDAYGQREGRGVTRKLRSTRSIGEKVSRMTQTTVEQTVAAVVKAATARGAVGIVWEDLKHWSVGHAHDEAAELSNRNAAAHRNWYFEWHQGMLRDALENAVEGDRLWFDTISAENDSRTCSSCGTVWATTGVYAKKGATVGTFGRMTWHKFTCSCGTALHADRNASINTALRGLTRYREAQAEAAK